MAENALTIKAFGDIIQHNMSKEAIKKYYDREKNCFSPAADAAAFDASTQEKTYELLFGALTYKLSDEESKRLPDISKSWISQTINQKVSIHSEIVKAAQKPWAAKAVADYFQENIISNIPKTVLSMVVDSVATLVNGDSSLGKKKIASLKSKHQTKAEADYLSEIWIRAVCIGANSSARKEHKNVKAPRVHSCDADICFSDFFTSHKPAKEFVDRETPRQEFYDVIDGRSPFKGNVMMYYGIGGIGKSSLIKKLKEYAKEQGILYSAVDFDDPSLRTSYKALTSLEKGFGVTFPHFDIAVTLCFIKRNPEFLPSDIGLPNELSRKALAAMQANEVSRFNVVAGLTSLIFKECGSEFGLDPRMQDPLSVLEDCSATAIEDELPVYFAYDLYCHMHINKLNKCILFFDTYELLWNGCRGEANKLLNDAWIRVMAEKLENVLFVLSGREPIQWTLDSIIWKDKAKCIQLDVLPQAFAEKFLLACNVEDEAIRSSIIDASRGHPYYIDLCVDTYHTLQRAGAASVTPEYFSGGFQKIQECFFGSLEGSEIEALRVLCVPHFYNYEIFELLNKRFNTGYPIANFNNFNSFSFIKDNSGGNYVIHVLMRDEIKKKISEEVKQSIDQCMIEYYEEKLKQTKISIEDIRSYFSELLYHLQESTGQDYVLVRVENNYLGIVKKLQKSGETKYLLNFFLDQFNKNSSSLWGHELFAVMVDMIHLSGQYKEAAKLISDYLDTYSLEEIATNEYSLNLYIRRVHHQMFYVPMQQLHDDLEKIIPFLNKNEHPMQYCEILFMLGGHVYLPMGDYRSISFPVIVDNFSANPLSISMSFTLSNAPESSGIRQSRQRRGWVSGSAVCGNPRKPPSVNSIRI